MASYNKVLLMGNLTRDPQLKYLPSQTAVVDFGLACNRKYKTQSGEQKEEVTFVDCSAFGRTAEVINEYFKKGKPIFIEGRLRYEQWEDKQGGGKRSRLSVHIDNFQFIGGREGGGGGGGAPEAGGEGSYGDEAPTQRGPARPPQQSRGPVRPPPPRPAQQDAPPVEQPFPDEQQFKDDDIPF
jgi:single-strand DNA-binding protein